ncbi:MAG: hypothetical protein RIM99_00550 [Cyclobacteriaceae bacterium]
MKKYRLSTRRNELLKGMKIEVFSILSEKFGSDRPDHRVSEKNQIINFQVDRLFGIIHDN